MMKNPPVWPECSGRSKNPYKLASNMTRSIFSLLPTGITMPATYLTSSVGPDQPIDNWLSWSSKDYEKIKDNDTFVAALLGVNRSGDIQTMYKAIPVIDENGTNVTIVGNSSQWKSNPSFSYVDATNVGSIILIEKLENIPLKIRPSESLPKPYVASTTWSESNNIAVCLVPVLALIFFGQKSIEGSVFDDDFLDKMKVKNTRCVWYVVVVTTMACRQ